MPTQRIMFANTWNNDKCVPLKDAPSEQSPFPAAPKENEASIKRSNEIRWANHVIIGFLEKT